MTKRATDDRAAEVSKLVEQAFEVIRSDPREAYRRGRTALRIARVAEDSSGVIASLRVCAQAAIQTGRFPTALRSLDAAIRGSADLRETAELESVRVQALTHLERYEEARDTAVHCLEGFVAAKDLGGEVRVRMALADLEFRLDRPRAALAQYARLDRILPDTVNPRVRAAIAANRANALEAANRFRAAERQFRIALDIFAAEGCDHTVAQVEYNAAYGEMLRGQYEQALRRYARTEDVFTKLGDERHLAHTDLDKAEIHLHLNMPEEARTLGARAEDRFRSLGLTKEAAQAALLTARGAELSGDREEAEAGYKRGQESFESLGLAERRFACLVQRAGLAERQGDLTAARALAGKAAGLQVDRMNPLSRFPVDLLRARLDLAEGDLTRARARISDVLDSCRRIHAPWVRVEAYRTLGRIERAAGRGRDAVQAYRLGAWELERHRGGVPPDEYMASFLAGRAGLYAELVETLVETGREEAAFEFVQRAKSRALVDLLATGRGRRRGGRSLADSRLRHLRGRLNAVYQRRIRGDEPESAHREARELEKEIGRILREQGIQGSEKEEQGGADTPGLVALRESLEPGVTIVEYLLTDSNLFIFVLTKDSLSLVRREVREAEIRNLIMRFRFHLARFRGHGLGMGEALLTATRENLAKLGEILLEPFADRLAGRRVVFAPHGILHHLPFHALPRGDGWLADECEILYAPSAAVYAFCGREGKRAGGRPAVFGLPDELAPKIEQESRRVAEILGKARLHLGEDATLERLRKEARRARVLHVATHGMFSKGQPMLSALRLADGWVNLYDLYDLEVRSEIVVLSSCESGTADVTDGDEILGLTRGFLFAGAPVLLTSQWPVNDAVTSEFMSAFYTNLVTLGDAAAACREAMAEVRSRHPHPYFWAPFFLTGRPITRRRSIARRPLPTPSGHSETRARFVNERSSV